MTLERENDDHKKGRKMSFGKRRRQRALQRAHRRELKALEDRKSRGLDLTQKETARLELLRDIHD